MISSLQGLILLTEKPTIFKTILKKVGFSHTKARELTKLAISLAQESRQKTGSCLIAGSIAPLEDCYSPNLVPHESILLQEHQKLVDDLADGGVDLFLIETMNTFKEAKVVFSHTQEYPDIPVIVSFTCDTAGNILSGDSWKKIGEFFKEKVAIVSVNCSSINGSSLAINELQRLHINNWGTYPNFGSFNNQIWSKVSNNKYIHDSLHEWITLQPKLIGTCCGAIPSDTKKLHDFLTRINI